jgi:hypothetical protein
MGHGSRESCRNLFKELSSLPLMSQYILSLPTFVSNHREQYFTNPETHYINTRHTSNVHLPRAHLNIYQKGIYYSGIFFNRFSIVFHGTSKHVLTNQEHLQRH